MLLRGLEAVKKDIGRYCRVVKIQLLQLLLDTFSVDNPMTAEEHYKNMEINDAYYQYMTHCFGKIGNDGAIFWRIFETMGGNDGERMPMTVGYMKEQWKKKNLWTQRSLSKLR